MKGIKKGMKQAPLVLAFIIVAILITAGCTSNGDKDDETGGGGGQIGSKIDTDLDGVLDPDDAFPNDIAASVDSDNDGYPDSWNTGYSESDSTTGLTLDDDPNTPADDDDADDDDDDGNQTVEDGDTWTFMVYMSDCDLEYFAISDFNEMELVGSSDKLNIVVQLDRWASDSDRDDHSNGDWTTAKRFLVQKDSDAEIISSTAVSDIGEINSGDPTEVVKFAQWAMTTYPADHYFLDLWDHGDGVEGVCLDQTSQPNDIITLKEIKSALDTITGGGTNKLDVVGFDACFMSTVEVAYEVSPYADFMVASEVTEPGTGWDYSFLQNLRDDPSISPVDLGKKIVDKFVAQKSVNPTQTHTLALLDLNIIEHVSQGLKSLITTVQNASATELQNLRTARISSQQVKNGQTSNMVDFYDFIEKVKTHSSSTETQNLAQNIITSLDAFIVYFDKASGSEDINVQNAHGLSLYAPEFGLAQQEGYEDTSFDEEVSWTDLLEDYYEEFEIVQTIYFVPDSLYYLESDEDYDGYADTIWIAFEIESLEDYIDGYLCIDVYDNLGYLVDYLDYTFTISSDEYIYVDLGELGFMLEEGDGEPGYYQMAIYICLGTEYNLDNIQDYAETDYVWLEYYSSGLG